jgi:hypothetical protein
MASVIVIFEYSLIYDSSSHPEMENGLGICRLFFPINQYLGRTMQLTEERDAVTFITLKEALNKSPLARRWLCGMGCAKGDDANG